MPDINAKITLYAFDTSKQREMETNILGSLRNNDIAYFPYAKATFPID